MPTELPYQTFRFTLTQSSTGEFVRVATLPRGVTLWRFHNLGDSDIQWLPNGSKSPNTDLGPGTIRTLPGHSSDVPLVVPAMVGEPIEIWARQTSTENPTLEIDYTTTTIPHLLAAMASMSIGAPKSDIQIGAVEVKDGSGDQRVTVTSGADGIKRMAVDLSGQTVTIFTSGGAVVASGARVFKVMSQASAGNQFSAPLSATAGTVLTSTYGVVTIASQDAIGVQCLAGGISSNGSGTVEFYIGFSVDGTNFGGTNNMSNAAAVSVYLNGTSQVYKTATLESRGMNAVSVVGVENKAGITVSGLQVVFGFSTMRS